MDTRVRGVLAVLCLASGTAAADRVQLSPSTGIVVSEWIEQPHACSATERWVMHKIVMQRPVFSFDKTDITVDVGRDHFGTDAFSIVDGDLVGEWDSDDRHVEVRVNKNLPWMAVVNHTAVYYQRIRIHVTFHPGTPTECEETWTGGGEVKSHG